MENNNSDNKDNSDNSIEKENTSPLEDIKKILYFLNDTVNKAEFAACVVLTIYIIFIFIHQT